MRLGNRISLVLSTIRAFLGPSRWCNECDCVVVRRQRGSRGRLDWRELADSSARLLGYASHPRLLRLEIRFSSLIRLVRVTSRLHSLGTLNLDSGMKDHVGSVRQAKMLSAAREPRRGEIDLWMKELTALSAERKWSRDGYRTRRMEDSLALAGTLAIL